MSRRRLVIFGTGDIGQLAHFYFTNDSDYEVVAFSADAAFITEPTCLGLPVVPFEDLPSRHPPGEADVFVALSYRDINRVRAGRCEQARAMGYKLATYICSRSVVWEKDAIGDNCLILENQTIQPFVRIGDNCIIWSGNHIGHHSRIADNCFIASHVVISGHVTVGANCFLGVNATLRDGVTVAPYTVVGAGAVIQKDTAEYGVYVARPASQAAQRSDEIDYFKS